MKYLIKGNDIPNADWRRVLMDENNKIYFLLKYSKNAFAGKFPDDSTESDWWWKPDNIKTSIADKVDPTTKEFNFEHQLDTANNLFSYNNKIEKIYHIPDTSNVTNMSSMFSVCQKLTTLDVNNFNTSNVTNMNSMFGTCSALTSLDLSNFDTSNVTSMKYMFESCSKLTTLDLSNFDTSNCTNMDGMISRCNALTSLDVSSFNTSNVTNMSSMFDSCYKLTTLDVSNFDTSKVQYMGSMFSGCYKLTTLDVSNFDTSNVTSMSEMFYGCSALTTVTGTFEGIKVNLDLHWSPLTNASAMVFINGLANVTQTKTIKFKTTTYNTLTPEQIAIATSKGWTVVSA